MRAEGVFPHHERYKENCIALGDNPYFCLGQCVRVIFGNVSWLFLMACIFIMSWFYILQPQTDFLQLAGHNHGQFITHQGLLMHLHISTTFPFWCSRCHYPVHLTESAVKIVLLWVAAESIQLIKLVALPSVIPLPEIRSKFTIDANCTHFLSS